jgi:hypothetical protein
MKTTEARLLDMLEDLTVSQLEQLKEELNKLLLLKKNKLTQLRLNQAQNLHPVCKT